MSFYLIKQYLSLGLSVYGIYEMNFGYEYLPSLLCGYFFLDIFVHKKTEIFFHHLISFILSYYFYLSQKNNTLDQVLEIVNLGVCMEYSNIFLFLKNIFDESNVNSNFKLINELCFVISFIYFRIIKEYYFIKNNDFTKLYNVFGDQSYLIFITIYSFFLLNLYWFVIILKKIYKKILKNRIIDSIIYSEYFLVYANLFNPIYILIKNLYDFKWYYYFDTLGIVFLSIINVLYHNMHIFKLVYNNNRFIYQRFINYNNFRLKIFNTRYFFYIITFCIHIDKLILLVYVFFSFLIHTIVISNLEYLYEYNFRNTNQIKKYNIINLIPVFFNVFLCSIYFDKYVIENLLICYLLFLVEYIKPFYNQNDTLSWFLLNTNDIYLINSYRN